MLVVVQPYQEYICCVKCLLDANSLRYDLSICTTLLYPLLIQRPISAVRESGIGASCWLEPAMNTRSGVTGEEVTFDSRRFCYGARGFIFRVCLANRRILV